MRLAFAYHRAAPETLGGAERYYATLCEGLAAAGEDVAYLTRHLWDGGGREIERRGVRMVAVARGGARFRRAEAGELAPKLTYAVALAWHLLRHGGRYDVVHVCCFPYPAVLAASAGLLMHRRTRLVVDWHEVHPPERWRARRGRWLGAVGAGLQSLALRCGDAAVTFSRLHAARLRARESAPATHVFPEFLPSAEAGPDEVEADREREIVFAGRLVPEKGVAHLPAVVAELHGDSPEWRATIFGSGPLEDDLRADVQRRDLGDSVRLAGFAPWSEVSAAFARAAALVFPSEQEGFGLVVLEAAAHGLPVVLVRAPDNAAVELVEEGRNGVVVETADPRDLAAAVLSLAGPGQPELARAWFEEAARDFSVGMSVAAHTELHRELVSS
jgi:glycosyltransferase involved in cell wall biosynthesis